MITLIITFIVISIILKLLKKDWKDYIIINSILSSFIICILSLIVEFCYVDRYSELESAVFTNITINKDKIYYSNSQKNLEDLDEIIKSDTTYYIQYNYIDKKKYSNITWVIIPPLGDITYKDTLFLSKKDWDKVN